MKRKFIFFALFASFLFLFSFVLTAQALPPSQLPQFSTPTPGADGRIIYIVKEGESCLRIQLLTGVPVEQLRALNRLDESCTIFPGQELVIGVGAGSSSDEPEAGPTPTEIASEPTPTPFPGNATVCLLLYDDVNGDALRQDTEVVIADGAISITGLSGQFSEVRATQGGLEATCFENVPEGGYNLSAAAPEGYYPTTQQTHLLEVLAGNIYEVSFGVQKSDNVIATTGDPAGEGGSSSFLGIVGGILLLLGVGLGVYSWSVFGRKPPMQQPPRPPSIVR
jgi:LysM repeat protein